MVSIAARAAAPSRPPPTPGSRPAAAQVSATLAP